MNFIGIYFFRNVFEVVKKICSMYNDNKNDNNNCKYCYLLLFEFVIFYFF